MRRIYHIAKAGDWAKAGPEWLISTRDTTLAQQGFIHCSDAHQLAGVANAFYAGMYDVVLLVIDIDRLTAPVRYEALDGTGVFPHIYGPLNTDAVVAVIPYAPGADGRFPDFPEEMTP